MAVVEGRFQRQHTGVNPALIVGNHRIGGNLLAAGGGQNVALGNQRTGFGHGVGVPAVRMLAFGPQEPPEGQTGFFRRRPDIGADGHGIRMGGIYGHGKAVAHQRFHGSFAQPPGVDGDSIGFRHTLRAVVCGHAERHLPAQVCGGQGQLPALRGAAEEQQPSHSLAS